MVLFILSFTGWLQGRYYRPLVTFACADVITSRPPVRRSTARFISDQDDLMKEKKIQSRSADLGTENSSAQSPQQQPII